MKSCKSRGSFCLTILTIYANDWSTFWHVSWCHVYFFFCEIPKYVQAKNRLPQFLIDSIRSEIFLQMKFIIFQGCPIKKAVLLLGQLVTYNQLLTELHLHKMLKLGFQNFKPIFLRMQFSLIATFFSIVLVNSLSWYLHLTIAYLTLVIWHFGSQMVFPKI